MSNATTSLNRLARSVAVLVSALVAFGAFGLFVGTAGAETPPPGPQIEAVAEADPPVWQGVDLQIAPLSPTAEIEVNCDTNTIEVLVTNNTTKWFWVEVSVDDVLAESGVSNPNSENPWEIPATENVGFHVLVTAVTVGPIFDDVVTVDCLLPQPAYEILTDCDTGQAHARLINHGDDTAYIGVQYPDVMHQEVEVAPHSSVDWLLAVAPGESIDFEIKASNVVIGTEHVDFVCEVPEAPTPVPTEEPVEAAEESPAEPVEEPTEAPVEETIDESADDELVQPIPVELAADEPADDEVADDEVAAGPGVAVSPAGSSGGGTMAIVLVGLGLVVLMGVALATTRRHTRSA